MRWGVFVGVVGTSLALFAVAGCEQTDGSTFIRGSYQVREPGINFRTGAAACVQHPGPVNCPTVVISLREGQRVYPICQRSGQVVGTNPYWVHAWGPRGHVGWVASWYLDHPANMLPELPDCTPDLVEH